MRAHAESLASYLVGLDTPELAELLHRHPSAYATPRPVDLRQVAVRILAAKYDADFALGRDLGQLRVLEAACASTTDPAADRKHLVDEAELRRLLGADQDDAVEPELRRALSALTADLLLWPHSGGFMLRASVLNSFSNPLGLGRPVRAVFAAASTEEIRQILQALTGPGEDRPATADSLAQALSDATVVERAASTLPEADRKVLAELTRSGISYNRAVGQLTGRGLARQLQHYGAVMPREVGLALRGAGFRAPLAPPPSPAVYDVPADKLSTAAEAAATVALSDLEKLLDAVADGGFTMLKNGGIGAGELRRLARLLHCTTIDARWLLYLADQMCLTDTIRGALKPTGALEWRDAAPARRYAEVLTAWTLLEAWPLTESPSTRPGQAASPLSAPDRNVQAPQVRRAVLQVLTALGTGRSLHDPEQLAALLHHGTPTVFQSPAPYRQPFASSPWQRSARHHPDLALQVLAEAERLGVVVDGAVTELGVALLSGDKQLLADAVTAVLPITPACRVLADHTVLATGLPTAELEQFLGSLAEPGRRDSHSRTWVISPASVRALYDADPHADPQRVLDELAAVSSTPIPQTVDYLVKDTARRHGTVTVTAIGTLIRTADPAAAAELLATRALSGLNLFGVGDTAIASPAAPDRVLAALRAAGLAPTTTALDGTVQVPPRPTPPSATGRPKPRPESGPRRPRRGIELTKWLSGLRDPSGPEGELDDLAAQIASSAPTLGHGDCDRLARAIETGHPVHVEYYDSSYGRRKLVVADAVLREDRPYGRGLLLEGTSTSHQLPLPLHDLLLVLQPK